MGCKGSKVGPTPVNESAIRPIGPNSNGVVLLTKPDNPIDPNSRGVVQSTQPDNQRPAGVDPNQRLPINEETKGIASNQVVPVDGSMDASMDHVVIQAADEQAFSSSFIEQRQRAINNQSYRKAVDSLRPGTVQQLVDAIKTIADEKSTIDRHWIIFYWIARNISYDTAAYFSGDLGNQSAESAFRKRMGVCAGYANLYKKLCDDLDIRCEIVSGYAKGYQFDLGKGIPTETNHAWNAVEIGQHWYLMESTWGSGCLDAKKFKRELTPYYFLSKPNELIYDHLPEDDKWQLLRQSISMEQYSRMPRVRPDYFTLGLQVVSPLNTDRIVLPDNLSYAEVRMNAPSDVILTGTIELNGLRVENGSLAQFDRKANNWQLLFAPRQTGAHKVTVFARRQNATTTSSGGVVEFSLNVTKLRRPMSFPTTYGEFGERRCQLYEPMNGLVTRGEVITLHILIPGAEDVSVIVDSKWLNAIEYVDQVLKKEVTTTAGSKDIGVYARFGKGASYSGLVKYSVQ